VVIGHCSPKNASIIPPSTSTVISMLLLPPPRSVASAARALALLCSCHSGTTLVPGLLYAL